MGRIDSRITKFASMLAGHAAFEFGASVQTARRTVLEIIDGEKPEERKGEEG